MSDDAHSHRPWRANRAARAAETRSVAVASGPVTWYGADRSDGVITLAGGRRVGVAQFGRPQGLPVVRCHGGLSSRIDAALAGAAPAHNGLRLIALDRPGIGRSSLTRNDDLLRWPSIVAERADQLGLETFGVAGWSAGGPYALACAYMLQDRVRAVAAIAGMAPVTDPARRGELGLGLDRRFIVLSRVAPRIAPESPSSRSGSRPTNSFGAAHGASVVRPSVRPLSRRRARRRSGWCRKRFARGPPAWSRTIARADPIGGSPRRWSRRG